MSEELSRRQLLQRQLKGAGGALLGGGLALSGGSAAGGVAAGLSGRASSGRAKSVIFLYLHGGAPSQDMFDLKPRAPREIRGEFSPIADECAGDRDLRAFAEDGPLDASLGDSACGASQGGLSQ
ncbi:MAG UNVERIFIED_CONTAM: DUF1501 domain-containing protein [Planctomycetaceae bacterium]|jgi:hypothetical protein